MAYVDVATLKRYLGVSGAGDDQLLAELITMAQAIIDADIGRTFEASADTTRTFDAVRDVDGPALRLDADLCAITSVTNGNSVVVTSGQYTTQPRNVTPWYELRLLGSSGLSWTYTTDPEDSISIVGRWAYSTTADALIAGACRRLAAYLYRQKDNAGDLDRAVIAGNTTILPAAIPSDMLYMMRLRRKKTL